MMIIPKSPVTLGCDTGPSMCALAKGIWQFFRFKSIEDKAEMIVGLLKIFSPFLTRKKTIVVVAIVQNIENHLI